MRQTIVAARNDNGKNGDCSAWAINISPYFFPPSSFASNENLRSMVSLSFALFAFCFVYAIVSKRSYRE